MSLPVQQRLDDFRRQRRLQAGSLITTVFGDAILPRGGRVWLGSLIRLLAPLGLSDRLIRTAVFRLVKEDWLQAESVGRRADYALSPAGLLRVEDAARRIYAAHAPGWDHRWRLILVVGELTAASREALRRALYWQGFGRLAGDCFVHPGADPEQALASLAGDGLSVVLPGLLPLVGAEARSMLAASDADLVARAWNLSALADAYRAFVATYQPIADDLSPNAVDEEAACLLRLLLIHDYRRLLLRDPELPEVLLPVDWPGQKARRLCAALYCRLAVSSERHLAQTLRRADGSPLPVGQAPSLRFAENVSPLPRRVA